MRISVPSDGAVGGTPTPRNDSVASVMIAVAMWMVAITSTGPMHVRQHVAHHDARAAARRSRARPARTPCCVSTSVEPRTVRAYCTQPATADRERSAPRMAMSSCASPAAATRADAVDQQRDQDRREGELHVGDAHDERVDAAAEVAGEEAERRRRAPATNSTEAMPDAERDARAVHDGRQHVAALVVGAEQVVRRCRSRPRPAA